MTSQKSSADVIDLTIDAAKLKGLLNELDEPSDELTDEYKTKFHQSNMICHNYYSSFQLYSVLKSTFYIRNLHIMDDITNIICQYCPIVKWSEHNRSEQAKKNNFYRNNIQQQQCITISYFNHFNFNFTFCFKFTKKM